jgi:3-oxoacyl-[acyl-carrier protein] reductase
MQLDLHGKHALVCGASQGIGLAAARELASLGARCTLMARNEERLRAAVQTLQGDGHAMAVADFSDPDAVASAAAKVIAAAPVDLLVNNTGGPPGGPAHAADPTAYLAAFSQHLICNQRLVQAVLPGMRAAGGGRIVNVISTSVKQPLDGLGVSNTVRGAVANWAKTLANELGPDGITVNNVLPGATRTARLDQIAEAKSAKTGVPAGDILEGMAQAVPLKRLGEAHEIGAAIAFLCSPAAAYISGVNLPVDGGRTRSL